MGLPCYSLDVILPTATNQRAFNVIVCIPSLSIHIKKEILLNAHPEQSYLNIQDNLLDAGIISEPEGPEVLSDCQVDRIWTFTTREENRESKIRI